MEIVLALIAFALMGIGVANVVRSDRGEDRSVEEPRLLCDLDEREEFRLESGSWNKNLPHMTTNPQVSGTWQGRAVEVVMDFKGEAVIEGPEFKKESDAPALVFCVGLGEKWAEIELVRETVKTTEIDVSGADVPIGDEGFDDDFILAGPVGDDLKERLRDFDLQRRLREIGAFRIRDRVLIATEPSEGMKAEDILASLGEYVSVADRLEGR